MILPFSTKLNGKETFFVEKILKGLYTEADIKNNLLFGADVSKSVRSYSYFINEETKITHARVSVIKPKLHTIRDDKTNRWRVGNKINFYINTRQKNMYCFAPILPVVSIQKIEIIHAEFMNDNVIKVDDKPLSIDAQVELAHNDGFDNLYEFFNYFNQDYVGKLIHWTDKKY